MMDNTQSSPSPSSIDVDPHGDVLLLLGPSKKVSLRVSSKALSRTSRTPSLFVQADWEHRDNSRAPPKRIMLTQRNTTGLASPVFAALFSPRFLEGQPLSSSTEVRNLPLPEDDSEAMTQICYAIHFHATVPRTISMSLLEDIASLCDKYDLAVALAAWSELWLRDFVVKAEKEHEWVKMMYISALFASHWVGLPQPIFLCSSRSGAPRHCLDAPVLPSKI